MNLESKKKALIDFGIDIATLKHSQTIMVDIVVDDTMQISDIDIRLPKQLKPMPVRAQKFYDEIAKVVKGTEYESNPVELRKFYEYWIEHGIHDKLMRFEKETSFGISRRLGTWFHNKNKSTTDKPKILTKKLSD